MRHMGLGLSAMFRAHFRSDRTMILDLLLPKCVNKIALEVIWGVLQKGRVSSLFPDL